MSNVPFNDRAARMGIDPRGRPPKQPPADAAQRIEELAADGWSIVGIAKKLGVNKKTLARWIRSDDELQAAFDYGREQERRVLHNAVYREAVEGEGRNKLLAAMFLLNSRHGYRSDDFGAGETRVNVTVNLPAAMSRDDYMRTVNDDRAVEDLCIPNASS